MATTTNPRAAGEASAATFAGEEEPSTSSDHSKDQSLLNDEYNYLQRMPLQSKSLLDDDDDDGNSDSNEGDIAAKLTEDARVTLSYNASVLLDTIASTNSGGRNNKDLDSFSQVSTTDMTPARNSMCAPARRRDSNDDKSSTVHTWDGFVRQGTRLKTLLDDAMHKVRDSLTGEKRPLLMASSFDGGNTNEKQDGPGNSGNDDQEPACQRRRTESIDHHHSAELARERMTEVMQLQRVCTDLPVLVFYPHADMCSLLSLSNPVSHSNSKTPKYRHQL